MTMRVISWRPADVVVSRVGLLSTFLLLAMVFPASAGPVEIEVDLPGPEGAALARLGLLPEDPEDAPDPEEGAGASGPSGSGPDNGSPQDPQDDFWTVVVAWSPAATPDPVRTLAPTRLPPLAGLLRDVGGQAPTLTVQDPLTLLLGEEPEDDPAPQATSTAPAVESQIPAAILVATAATAATFAVFFLSGSTSAAGAGLSGPTAAGRKTLPVFSPLFTRFEGKKVLEHPNRAHLYTLVAGSPGIRLQDLCEETHLSRTAVTHHMRLLEQQHVVVSKKVGRSRHFYENGGRFERQQKDAYAVLQNDRSRTIARFIRENPGSIQKDLCDALDMRASIAHWHVKRLSEAHLVEPIRQGRTVSYFPAEAMAEVAL